LPIINIFNKNAEVLGEFEYIAKAGEQISKTIAAPATTWFRAFCCT
jgi:valyl-tRNA synthetase